MGPYRTCDLRVYGPLNDFLPRDRQQQTFVHTFFGTPAVKDVVESAGVPHTEVDIILVDGRSVGFDARLEGDERVAVYPSFERLDTSPLTRLKPEPLREPKFIADVHLGKLARYLRLLGFDTSYERGLNDEAIAQRASAARRIVLTRDRGLLKRSIVTRGYSVRSTHPEQQLREVVDGFELSNRIAPFTRCLKCNGKMASVDKASVVDRLPPATRETYHRFLKCMACDTVFWPGAHHARLESIVRAASTP